VVHKHHLALEPDFNPTDLMPSPGGREHGNHPGGISVFCGAQVLGHANSAVVGLTASFPEGVTSYSKRIIL
jgi:hypothetical protein